MTDIERPRGAVQRALESQLFGKFKLFYHVFRGNDKSGDLFGQGGGEKLAQRRGVPFLGSIPLEPQVRVGGDGGTPVVVSHPDSAAALALTRIAQEVAVRASTLTLQQEDTVIPLTTIG